MRSDPWPLNPQGELLLGVKLESPEGIAHCEEILKTPGLSPHYVLEISKSGPLDHLAVVVEGEQSGAAALAHDIKSYIGVSAEVRIGTIERSIGKAKRVIDKRPR